ncbi:hypothetical protein KI387_002023, partial [Taxus chinensis]
QDVPSFGSRAKATRVQAFLASRGPKFDSTGFKNRIPVVGIYVPAVHTCNQALHVHNNLGFGSSVNRHRIHQKPSAYFGSMKLIQ